MPLKNTEGHIAPSSARHQHKILALRIDRPPVGGPRAGCKSARVAAIRKNNVVRTSAGAVRVGAQFPVINIVIIVRHLGPFNVLRVQSTSIKPKGGSYVHPRGRDGKVQIQGQSAKKKSVARGGE